MSGKPRILKLAWKCSCGACNCVNLLLALLALHLTLWILLDSMGKVIPLPDILTRWVVQRSIGPDYSANWSKAVFDLRGGVYLEGIHLRNKLTDETILTAKTARVNWAVFHILTRMFPPIDELEASQISLYLPASYMPSGLNEPAVAIRNLAVEEKHGALVVHDLQMQAGGIFLNLTGQGALNKPATSLKTEKNRENQLPKLYAAIARLQRLSPDIKAILDVDWKRQAGGDQQFEVRFILPSMNSQSASLRNIDGIAGFAYSNAKVRYYRLEVSGYLSSLNLPVLDRLPGEELFSVPALFQLSATGKPISVGAVPLPSDLELILSLKGNHPQFLELATISTSLDSDVPLLKGVFKGPHIFVSGFAAPLDPGPIQLSRFLHNPIRAEFNARLDSARLDEYYPEYPEMRLLEETKARTLNLHATFQSEPFSISGTLYADDFHVGATDFANLKTDFLVDRQHLSLNNAHVQVSPSEFATGAYHHAFASSRFSLYAMGKIFPTSLDSLLGKWWIRVFSNIRVNQPAHGNVSVWGHWRDLRSIQSITDAHGEGAYYRDYPIPHLKVRVRSNQDWVTVNRFEGNFDDHEILGQIDWRMSKSPDAWRPMRLDFKSDAPWEAVVAASGVSYLERFRVDGNPLVEARGILWNPPRNNRDLDAIPDLDIHLNTRKETLDTGKLRLSDLNISGRVRGDNLNLDAISGTFAGGIFTGSVRLANWSVPEKLTRHLKLQLFDADYRDAVYQLTDLLKNREGVRKALLRNTTRGRADANVDLMLSQDVNLAFGNGQVILRQTDIGQIHMLGGLSRALTGMGLGFSSLDLNAASMKWKLTDGIFNVQECQLSGPVLNLAVNGNIDLPRQEIDLQANVMLFRGLVGQVFAPVGDTFQFDLSGPLDNPSWQVRLNPFRWFQNRLTPSPRQSTP